MQLSLSQVLLFSKGEKVLFVLEEEEMMDENFLAFLSEFILVGHISHLFSLEETTSIINSVRSEVTQAGLTYTRDVAWQFFLE
jgi:dynein heavy chain